MRRQKEIARKKKQEDKRKAKAIRKAERADGQSPDEEATGVEAEVDTGLPGEPPPEGS